MIQKTITAIVLMLFCQFQAAAGADGTDNVLAEVSGEQLTTSILESQIKGLPPALQAVFQDNAEKRKELVDRWIEITLLAKEAEGTGIADLPDVKTRVNEFRKQVLAKELVKTRLKQTTSIPEEELKEYYDSHSGEFTSPEQVRVSHILISLPSEPTAEDEETARKKIEEVQEKLKQGQSFSELAEAYSDDPNTKNQGGDLGLLGKGSMLKEFEDVAFSTNPDSVSEPFRTKFGWHILKTTDRIPSHARSFQEVEKELESRLIRQKNTSALDSLITELKVKYPVVRGED